MTDNPNSPAPSSALTAPLVFTPDEVLSLNEYQASGFFHPFTCASGNRCDEKHAGGGSLIATVHGWLCPFCDYTQDWAHDFMKNGDWKISGTAQRELMAKAKLRIAVDEATKPLHAEIEKLRAGAESGVPLDKKNLDRL